MAHCVNAQVSKNRETSWVSVRIRELRRQPEILIAVACKLTPPDMLPKSANQTECKLQHAGAGACPCMPGLLAHLGTCIATAQHGSDCVLSLRSEFHASSHGICFAVRA